MIKRPLVSVTALLAACSTTPPPSWPHPLAGSAWQRSDDADAGPHFPTMAFVTDTASGFAGCNTWSATITGDDHALRFGQAATTRIMCPPSSMQTERNFLPVLEHTRSYVLRRTELTLLDGDGIEIARFTCADQDCPHPPTN